MHILTRANLGGVVTALAALLPALQQRGHEIIVLHGKVPHHEMNGIKKLQEAGIKCTYLESMHKNALNALHELWLVLSKLQPDIVHSHMAKAGALSRILCSLLGIPCVHHYHGHVFHGYFNPLKNKICLFLERQLAKLSHNCALSRGQLEEIRDSYGVAPHTSKWSIIGNAAPKIHKQKDEKLENALKNLKKSDNIPVIAALSRLCAIKNLTLFCDSINHATQYIELVAFIGGDGEEFEKIQNTIQTNNLPVHMPGAISNAAAYAAMDILMISSRNEGLPMTALEAFQLGIPVVSTSVGALKEFAQSGAVTCPQNDESLGTCLVRVLKNEALQNDMRKAGYKIAAQYQADKLAEDLERIYVRLSRN